MNVLARVNIVDADAILKRCLDYLGPAEDFLAGRRKELPDASRLAKPFGCILEARADGEDLFNLGTPFVAAKIEDLDAPDEERRERYFDPWDYALMLVMLLAGARFRFDRSKYARYYFLAYVGPVGKVGNHSLRRIIMNPPPASDVRQTRRTPDAHLDYRRAGLKAIAKRVVRKLGQMTRSHSRGREDSIAFAVELFARQLATHGADRFLGLNVADYEALLRRAVAVADAMHSAVHDLKAGE
ncbi:hypothetical protein ABIF61_005813 [Bradyrhizobium japonicum]